jgi:predicted permease
LLIPGEKAGGDGALSHLFVDLRHAFRGFRRQPLFAAIAVVSMALGIAANTAVFTLVDQVVLRQLPVIRPGELVQVAAPGTESYGGGMGDGTELSYAMYRDLRDHNEAFTEMAARFVTSLNVTFGGTSERAAGELVTGTFFPMLGAGAEIGRVLTPEDDTAPGRSPVAVLGYDYWRARFAGDPSIIGKTLQVNGHALEVVGVASRRFTGLDFGTPAQVYVPLTMQPQMGPPWLHLEGRRFRWVQVYGRLRPGVSAEAARASLQPLYHSILVEEAQDPAFANASAETKQRFLAGKLAVTSASRGHSFLRGSITEPLLILMAVAVGLLLIVCANVANLLIARGAARRRELALRLAVGATPLRIARLLLVESLALAVLGAALGLPLAQWGAGALLAFFRAPESPLALSASPDARILLFTSGIAVVTALLAGLLPAARSRRLEPGLELKASGGTVVGEQPRLRKALVIAQVALSSVLLIAAGLFLRSLENLLAVDPGFRTVRVLTFGFDLAENGYDAAQARSFVTELQERLTRVPGVASAAYAFIPVLGGGAWGLDFTIEGKTPGPGQSFNSLCNAVSPGYFETLGIPLLAGREFDERDGPVVPTPEGWPYRVAVVNEAFAKRYFGGESPIGRQVGIGEDPGTPTPIEIVGLARDAHYMGVREDVRPQIFFPYLQASIESVTALVRTRRDPATVLSAVRREMAELDPGVALYEVATLEDKALRSVVNERLIAGLSTVLASVATLLSVVGLYGVMAFLVTRRTREIGIRMALGALARQIASGVLREAGALVALGLALGLGAAWWLGRYVESQLYGVAPTDPRAVLLAAAGLCAVAALAAGVPAWRAARVSPMSALREE